MLNNIIHIFTAFFEPTDMRIASKPFQLPRDLIHQIKFISPNIYELDSIAKYLGCCSLIENNEVIIDELFKDTNFIKSVINSSNCVAEYIDNVVITLGSNGILVSRRSSSTDLRFFNTKLQYNKPSAKSDVQHRFYGTKKIMNIVNVSGAGDSFNVGFITAMINSCYEDTCVSVGIEGAKAALNSTSAVPDRYFSKKHECWSNTAIFEFLGKS